jgi:hypothetical protein
MRRMIPSVLFIGLVLVIVWLLVFVTEIAYPQNRRTGFGKATASTKSGFLSRFIDVAVSEDTTWWETSADFVPLPWRNDTLYHSAYNACIGSNDTIYKSVVVNTNYNLDPAIWRTSDIHFWSIEGPPDYQGNWDNGTEYTVGQKVMYGNQLWEALQFQYGVTPIEGADWTLFGDAYNYEVNYTVNQYVYDGEQASPAKCLLDHGYEHARGAHSVGEQLGPVWQVFTTFQIWNSGTTYALNAKVLNTAKSQVYRSLYSGNKNHAP